MKFSGAILGLALFWGIQANAAEFMGYTCTKDCSGHKAGYEWAKKKNLTDPADCRGRSNSFVEGCRAFTLSFEDTPYQAPEDGDVEEDSAQE